MIRKILVFLFSLFLMFPLSSPVFATESKDTLPIIIDQADILYSTDEQMLNSKALELASDYDMDIVILTVDTLDGIDTQDYADAFFEQFYGEDGILFLLAMAEREWYISTAGEAIYALTDYGIQDVGECAVSYFSEGSYYDGFVAYLDALNIYLHAYQNGSTIDGYADYSGDYYHGDREEIVYRDSGLTGGSRLMIALAIGLVSAGITLWVMRLGMNSKRAQRSAEVYLKTGSYRLHTHADMFLYSNIHKVRRQQNNNSGSRGGGSSVHRSSGGRRHGGGGGKF